MSELGSEVAELSRALGDLDQARGSLQAAAETVATNLVEQLPADLGPLVTTANMPIRLADQLDDRVTSRHSFAPRARWYRVNYAICEITWWVAVPGGRRLLCPEPVATLVREPYGHHGRAAVLVDVRWRWSDGNVELAPAGAELFHAGVLGWTPRCDGRTWYDLASDEEIRAFAVEARFVGDAFTAEVAHLAAAGIRA
jgi:hypothetical protein